MKRIIAAIAACALIMALFAGCGGQQAQQQVTRKSAKEATGDEAKVLSAIESLETYMIKKGFLTEDVVKYSTDEELPKIDGVKETHGYELIGADFGAKYQNGNVLIELYYFSAPDKNDAVKAVKSGGKFTLYDREISAYLACDGKYMMIYTDKGVKEGDTESDAYKTMQKAIKTFEEYKE